ncbi:MAG TPA: NapC/NirT family cytochrome c, partial [Anaerolineae bacterium]|nr:NapC/NirT family cytochrome c [Anaerolineae bacterium]
MTKSEWTGVARNRLIAVLLLAGACFAVGLVVLGLVAVQTWEYTNSVSFCSNACHDVHPEEPVAYEDSYHARVKCVDCHMGRVSTLRAIALKSSHSRHLLAVLSGRYERPLESASMRPANETCERCHSPSTFHDDTARVIQRFLPNEDNSEKRTYLLLKTGTGAQEPSNGYGIHWHISNQVEYIAADDHKQEIRWVRASLPDGRTVEYNDVLNPLSPEEIDRAEKRVMDCVDCHNRIGHAYLSPEKLIDKSLTEGRLSPALPFAKKEMFAVLAAEYVDQAEALAAADSIRGRYQEAYPEVAAAYAAEIEQAVQLAKELIPRLVFEEPGVTWQSFSDNIGHKTTPGCFRCHDGKHVSQEGESIRLKCGLCHGIPVTVDASDGPPEMPIAARQEPLSHLETSFVSDHRFTASESCVECHGVVDFGEDDSSFCANSACHGLAWPMVDLDAIFAHPVRLEGGHAGVECYRCHNGVGEISYACSNCHEPVAEPHYGPQCQDCHIAGGFELASTEGFLHPMALEGRHDNLGCGACHSTAKVLASECSTCHLAPQDHVAGSCNTCHMPDGWVESALTLVARGPDIPHVFSESDGCLLCHDPEGQNWPAPPSHRTYDSGQCSLCHTAGSGAPIAVNHDEIPGLLQGEHAAVDCVQCHEGGVFQGTSQSCYACHQGDDRHGGQFGQECAECHTPNGWQGASIDHNRTRFPLTGRHSGASCTQCHANGSYAGTPRECSACHGEPAF